MRVVRGDRFVGFCGGVKRAWKLAVESSENGADEEVFISGKLIHNTPAMQELATMGVRPSRSPSWMMTSRQKRRRRWPAAPS